MTKRTGLGDNLYVAEFDLSGDAGSIGNIGGGPAPLVVTGINKHAPERLGGIKDGRLEFRTWFNPAAAQAHEALSPLPTSDVIVSYLRGTTLGDPAASMVAKQVGYDGTRGADGSLDFGVSAQATVGVPLAWGRNLTAGVRTDTGATNGASIDDGAGTAFGLLAYLHVFDFTGTDVTIKIQHSSDDGAGDPFADLAGGSFVVNAVGADRKNIASPTSVERYLRCVTATTGGFTSVDFALVVVRNVVEPDF